MRHEIPHLHSPAPGWGDPGPERQDPGTQGVHRESGEVQRESERQRDGKGGLEMAQKVGGVPGIVAD